MGIVITERIERKLKDKHQVLPDEVVQCFYSRVGRFLEDTREQHWTYPPTQWFIADTAAGRRLKVVFVQDESTGDLHIKTAYEPIAIEEKIYDKYS